MIKIVRESLIVEANQLELSAGLVIVQKGTILLCHPTGQKWWGTYSIPKGHVQEGEDLIDAAIRETKEEVGIVIDKRDIIDKKPKFIDYKDNKGKLYKRVYYFLANPSELIMKEAIIADKTEVDWAGFILPSKAEHRILWRLKPVLAHIDEITEKEKERIKKKKEKEAEKKKATEKPTEGKAEETNTDSGLDLDF